MCVFSHVWLFVTPCTVVLQAPLSMEFSRQRYWNRLPFPTPGDLPNTGIKAASCIDRQILTILTTYETPFDMYHSLILWHLSGILDRYYDPWSKNPCNCVWETFFCLFFSDYWLSCFFFFSFIFISWRLITLQYCSGFCHTLTWISHGFICVPHPDPLSHLPLRPIPLGLPSAPALVSCI